LEKDYKKILSVKPGITDNAAIEFRNEETIMKALESINVESRPLYLKMSKVILMGLVKSYIKKFCVWLIVLL
jgi:lipopolysaccharide/colanic/teichoic acid biosynthesis glycosyltransferase